MIEKRTETLKDEGFYPRSFSEEIAELGFLSCLSGSKFCSFFQLNLCFPRKRREQALVWGRIYVGLASLHRRAAERGQVSSQITGNTKAKGEARGLVFFNPHSR